MKKLVAILAILTVVSAVIWQNRINLIVWGLPKIAAIIDPIAPNRPVEWQRGPDTASSSPAQRPPNVILILADDMGFNDVSLYNGGAADGSLMTPNIDELAHQGVRFDNGYAANAVCSPSRATIMTGRYSTRFGFEFTPVFRSAARIFKWMQDLNDPPLRSRIDLDVAAAMPDMAALGMPTEEITIAELLRDAGYYTAHIGKWHLGNVNGMHPLDQGFEESLYMAGMLYLPEDHADAVNAKRQNQSIERMVWANSRYIAQWNRNEYFEPAGYLTDYYTDNALEVISNNRHRPFFLYLAHWGIHNPLQALRSDYEDLAHITDHHLRVYAAMIRAMDRSIGKITEALEENGLTDNTLIVFTSDNGGASYIGLPDVNKPYRGWKLTHFEGGTHVPFMAKWPSIIRPGSVFNAPVHHIDLYHTIAAAAGVPVPTDRKLDGVDLVPYINGATEGVPHETLFWREGHHQAVQHLGWKLIRADRPENARWLFNLEEDPTEQNNLATREPAKLAELEALLSAHNAEQMAPLWPSFVDSPQRIDHHGEVPYEPGEEYIYWPN